MCGQVVVVERVQCVNRRQGPLQDTWLQSTIVHITRLTLTKLILKGKDRDKFILFFCMKFCIPKSKNCTDSSMPRVEMLRLVGTPPYFPLMFLSFFIIKMQNKSIKFWLTCSGVGGVEEERSASTPRAGTCRGNSRHTTCVSSSTHSSVGTSQ